jgi:hypothetical protein
LDAFALATSVEAWSAGEALPKHAVHIFTASIPTLPVSAIAANDPIRTHLHIPPVLVVFYSSAAMFRSRVMIRAFPYVKRFLVAAGISLCAGCASRGQMTTATAPMLDADFRAWVVASRSTLWKDPASVRDASVGHAYACSDGDSCLCVSANAKNGFGGYTGVQKNVVVMRGDRFLTFRPWDFGDQCENLTPLAELNGDYIAPVPVPPAKRHQRS